jgi:hypothetical protein
MKPQKGRPGPVLGVQPYDDDDDFYITFLKKGK